MSVSTVHSNPASRSRREFLRGSAFAAVGGALAGPFALAPGVFAGGSDTLKLGLIGCGGRGSGAAADALQADTNLKLVAMGDAFADKLQNSLNALRSSELADKVAVATDRQFVGFDAYKQVIDSGVDVVILATPPVFRPEQLAYAVEKGKHVFAEKPVAVDGPGVRSVIDTCRLAKQKGLSVVSGLCWRYHPAQRAVFQKIHEGAIGDLLTIQATYLTQTLKKFPRQPEWSDMEFQLRNWQHMTWLSGDFNVEQHVHSLDKVAWAMKDEPPVRCTGVGGRLARSGPESGNVYDQFSVVYEYANGARAFCTCRQVDGCSNDVTDHFYGTKGVAHTQNAFNITSSGKVAWAYEGAKKNEASMYQIEHSELFASIRNATPINNGEYMTRSSLLAIMGRMSAYTGKTITWEQALNSKERLAPPKYEWGPLPLAPVAVPGVTPFV
ncbi:MAG: Gfo/Idh/MocA family protein [Planctomycetaceae bacterium]